MHFTEDELAASVQAFREHGSKQAAADAMGMTRDSMRRRLARAGELGMLGYEPVVPGFRVSQITTTPAGNFIQQKAERGEVFELPIGQKIKGVSALVDPDGREIIKWVKTDTDREASLAAMRAAVEAFKEEIPRAEVVPAPAFTIDDILCQYTLTDSHLGAMAWNVETGGGDYDLAIGEKLIVDWFSAAIAGAPPSKRAVFAQLGDFLHHDSFKSITPEHGHLLDADSRYSKMVRVAIRVVRQVMRMLLTKHEQIHVIMADANHDPASEVWLREMFAVVFEDEPRVTVDTNPGPYSMVEHGLVSLYYHHGHRRNISNVDSVFVGKFREAYGRTRFSFAHIGHRHSDELKSTNLMKVEQHETLAAPDAYAANSGWLSGRSAKVIYYHAKRGEVGRNTITAEMVADWSGLNAANDNEPLQAAA